MSQYLCFGDYICLYCENTKGYMYSEQSSSSMDGLFVYAGQDKDRPTGVPNVHAVTFQVFSMNRYKLSKKYRALVEKHGVNPEDEEIKKKIQAAKKTADVEVADNTAEQSRLLGKRLCYGQTVQFLHLFTNKFITISTDNTSVVDKSKMMVSLVPFSSKNAQFKIQPRYNIKVEGEFIEVHDQIVLESVKSPGNFLHASDPYQLDSFTWGSELNAGVDVASFTVIVHYRQSQDKMEYLKGGDVIRLFHKDVQAYLVAEGGFRQPPVEDVHLRIREANPKDPRTLYQPKSGITYWQVELASSILDGNTIHWEGSVRFRHMTTRRYLAFAENFSIFLTNDGLDAKTVFKIHSLSQRPEAAMVKLESNIRIQHVVTGCWLHAPVDLHYFKMNHQTASDEMDSIRWDFADLLQASVSPHQQYQDAFAIQKVSEKEWRNFNYVAGIIPFIDDLIVKRQNPEYLLTLQQTVSIATTLRDLKNFLEEPGERRKDRQKLLRNLCAPDAMVRLLTSPVLPDSKDKELLHEVFRQFYEVFYIYTKGRSKKNALYAAKYLPFFLRQLSIEGEVGLECCKMLIELIRDNRRIVDRITPQNIMTIIDLFQARQHYLYLVLLGVLSVCEDIAMTENQTQIAEELLLQQREYLYHLELGQDIGLLKDNIYVSMDNRKTWMTLHSMSYKSNANYSEQRFMFLNHQLQLYKLLCYGRNEEANEIITRNREFCSWEVAYTGLTSELLPFSMRALFCDLLIELFIDVGENHSIITVTSNNFVYDEIDIHNFGQAAADAVPHEFDSHFPSMRVWMGQFLNDNNTLISSVPGRNVLLKQVLRMVTSLVRYGFMGAKSELDEIMKPILSLIDGTKDLPFAAGVGRTFNAVEEAMVREWRRKARFEKGPETEAAIQVKIQGLDMIDMLLVKEVNRRVRYFVSVFKRIEMSESRQKSQRKLLYKLLYDNFDETNLWENRKIRNKIDKFLKNMYETTELLDPNLPAILFDLTKYPSDVLNTKALSLLNKFYASKLKLLKIVQMSHALTTVESVRVHRDALKDMVTLLHFSKSKLSNDMAWEASRILSRFAELCYVPHRPDQPHQMGQDILVNNGLLDVLIPMVTQDVDRNLKERFLISEKVVGPGLKTLRFLAQQNTCVQGVLMDKLDELLTVKCCGEQLALALLEIFRNHTEHCLRLQAQHVQTIVKLAGRYRARASSFLSLLKAIIKMEDSGTLLKRNQQLVTKYIMENYKSAAYVMSLGEEERLEILIGKQQPESRVYLIRLIELLATCAEGENRYVESLCQTLLTAPELINILNNRHVPMLSKVGFARYLIWSYMLTARNIIESGVDEMHHDPEMWKHFRILLTAMSRVNKMMHKAKSGLSISEHERIALPRKSIFVDLLHASKDFAKTPLLIAAANTDIDCEGIIKYMLHVGFHLLQTFFSKFYKEDKENYPEEPEILRKIASTTLIFTEFCGEFTTKNEELAVIIECIETFGHCLKVSQPEFERICNETNLKTTLKKAKVKIDDVAKGYNHDEQLLNKKMHNFGKRLAIYLENQNTLKAQLGIFSSRPYLQDELEVKIPLGREFQVHVQSFAPKGPAGCQRVRSIIDHLEIAALNVKNPVFKPDEELDIRCLQILRSLIYNKYIALPDNWSSHIKQHTKLLDEIKAIQDAYLDYNIVSKILPLLDRPIVVAMEVLSLIDLMLFNVSKRMQKSVIDYFNATAEEIFFIFVRQRIKVASMAEKERRSIEAQAEARRRELSVKLKERMHKDAPDDKEKKLKLNKRAMRKKSLKPFFHRLKGNHLLIFNDKAPHQEKVKLDIDLMETIEEEEEEDVKDHITLGNYEDGADVVLVFRILARICDGQYAPLQDYLRSQPDNLRKVNLVAEMTVFFSGLYTHINSETIILATQVISAIMEISMGNQENRAVVLNNKIVDYSNFLLRISQFEGCSVTQVVGLKMELATLLMALIEENGPVPIQIAREVRDTLDLAAIKRHISLVYTIVTHTDDDVEKLVLGKSSPNPAQKIKLYPDIMETINVLGFRFYILLARLFDVDPKLQKQGFDNQTEKLAFHYFKHQCRSVEIVKDGHLQKVHFRVRDPDLLREEVIEEVKWNIDRTSTSNKLRDLLRWSKDIIKDIEYQNRFLKNKFLKQLAAKWQIWNLAAIFLSLAINILMLATWDARGHVSGLPLNITALPPELLSHQPLIKFEPYYAIHHTLASLHNFSSLMLFIAYFLRNHPRAPNIFFWKKWKFFKRCKKKSDELLKTKEGENNRIELPEEEVSRLQPNLLSGVTIYYLMLTFFSFAGTFMYSYFFAFNLINIVSASDLLKGVVKAVTVNGKSLLLVGILGVIIIYIYALIAFAFFRPSFAEEHEMYCRSLFQCFITVMRYGITGGITQDLVLQRLMMNFVNFSLLSIYQLSFFILFTTIGLNIILGITVDTFSELRDRKWTAEKDMRDTCFICGRFSYDFEHEGNGFNHHVEKEHNMWSYVFYLLYLKETTENDCGAIDIHVLKMVRQDQLEFFPMARALCLSPDEEEEGDNKLDSVVATLTTMEKRHQIHDEYKRREAERRRQMAWQDQFRYTVERGRRRMSTAAPDGDSMSYMDESSRSETPINNHIRSKRVSFPRH